MRLPVRENRHACRLGKAEKLFLAPGEPRAAAHEDRGTFGFREPAYDLYHGFGARGRRRVGKDFLGHRRLFFFHAGEKDVDRNFHEDGAGPPRPGDPQGLREKVRNPLRPRDPMGPLRERRGDGDLVETALERQAFRVPERSRSGQKNDRNRVQVRVRDRRDDVGEAGPRGHQRHTGLARRPRPAVGRVTRGLLVPGVDEADTVAAGRLVDGIEVSPVQGENRPHARFLEDAQDEFPSVDFGHGFLPVGRKAYYRRAGERKPARSFRRTPLPLRAPLCYASPSVSPTPKKGSGIEVLKCLDPDCRGLLAYEVTSGNELVLDLAWTAERDGDTLYFPCPKCGGRNILEPTTAQDGRTTYRVVRYERG
ncbi:MAG: hypothetical protein KatS3mg076_2759 [Candidatus Binatia bacterium]|nr:MAG: hypothetical protein KatS3mg076_2759 [Candidatus Binatia bacterium]